VRELRPLVKQWYEAAEPRVSGEHDFAETWAEFVYGWPRVKKPKGDGAMVEAMKRADAAAPPQCVIELGSNEVRRLVALCRELQRNAGEKPFFIGYRQVAELLNIDRTTAGKLMHLLVVEQVLQRVAKGHTGRASEYRYLGD